MKGSALKLAFGLIASVVLSPACAGKTDDRQSTTGGAPSAAGNAGSVAAEEPEVSGGGGNASSMCGAATGSDWFACLNNSDCSLTPNGCCDVCDTSGGDALAAVRTDRLSRFRQSLACDDGTTCTSCEPVPELRRELKYFRSACVDGRCAIQDVRHSELTACSMDNDCSIRASAKCCDPCDNQNYIALQKHAYLCNDDADASPVICSGCGSFRPTDLEVACEQGYCVLKPKP